MIEVRVSNKEFAVVGHALVGHKQAPVVCAIVSVMTQAIEAGAVRFRYEHGSGRFLRRKNAHKALLVILEQLADRFPRNVKVVRA